MRRRRARFFRPGWRPRHGDARTRQEPAPRSTYRRGRYSYPETGNGGELLFPTDFCRDYCLLIQRQGYWGSRNHRSRYPPSNFIACDDAPTSSEIRWRIQSAPSEDSRGIPPPMPCCSERATILASIRDGIRPRGAGRRVSAPEILIPSRIKRRYFPVCQIPVFAARRSPRIWKPTINSTRWRIQSTRYKQILQTSPHPLLRRPMAAHPSRQL